MGTWRATLSQPQGRPLLVSADGLPCGQYAARRRGLLECAPESGCANKAPLRGRRVEGFGEAAKTDTSRPQFLNGFDQLLHRARQTVELPHDQRVAAASEFQRVAQGWSIRYRARHLLDENLATSSFSERVPLQGKILVNGRNPRVADQHAFRRRFPVRPWRRMCPRRTTPLLWTDDSF
jgi:hypothetical protein